MTNKQSGMCPAEPVRHVPGSYTDSALIANLSTKTVILSGPTVRAAAVRGPPRIWRQIRRLPTKIDRPARRRSRTRLVHPPESHRNSMIMRSMRPETGWIGPMIMEGPLSGEYE